MDTLGLRYFLVTAAVILVTCLLHLLNRLKWPLKLPLIGHTYLLIDPNMHIVFTRLAKKYGNIFQLSIFGKTWIVLSDPDLAKQTTMHGRSLVYSSRLTIPFYQDYTFINGEPGVVFGSDWRRRRKVIQPLLSPTAVTKDLTAVLTTEVGKFISALETKANNGIPFDPAQVVWPFLSSVMYTVLFGRSLPFDDPRLLELADWVTGINDATYAGQLSSYIPLVKYLPLPAWKLARKYVHRRDFWIQREMADLRARMTDCGKDDEDAKRARESFMAKLITEDHDWVSENVLIMFVNDLVFAGIDTTSAALTYFFSFMANHSHTLERIQEEISKNVPANRPPSMQDEPNLVYTNAAINELLRLRPSAPLVPHSTSADDTLNGFLIPKDTEVWYNIWGMHRHPRYWSEPVEEFDPDRFIRFAARETSSGEDQFGNDIEKDNPAKLVYFGFGRRACPGLVLARHELFIAITHLSYYFNIKKPEGVGWVEDGGHFGTTLIPKQCKIVIERRREE